MPEIFKHYPGIQAVYLFGSRAAGTAHATSDLDLAIVPCSPTVRQRRLDILTDLARHGFCNVDLVILDTNDITLKYEAARHNNIVYQIADFDRGALYSLTDRNIVYQMLHEHLEDIETLRRVFAQFL